jgi:3(or 17)beta-hydroxysteroid dehydrogenase
VQLFLSPAARGVIFVQRLADWQINFPVAAMAKSAALSCAERNYKIRVNSVHPAYVSTSMTKNEAVQLGISEEEYMESAKSFHPIGLGEPIDVAYLDLYLASDESKWVTGAEFTIDGGATSQ